MNNTKPTSTSPKPPSAEPDSASLFRYNVADRFSSWIVVAIVLLAIGGAALLFARHSNAGPKNRPQHYEVTNLPTLGGTNSRGSSINNRGWVAGHSTLPGNQARHATIWRDGVITDLGTLGGPNSSVVWPVKNNNGIIVGISQTATPEPLGQAWSSAFFYGGPSNVGFINLGFAWEDGQMRALPTLGGHNGFAAGANNRGQAVGWAENTTADATCVAPQVLQFRPVMWDLKQGDEISEFPLIPGDTSGAATSINNRGQAVGISGICDQAVGRHTAKHAVLWDKGTAIDIGDFGANWWNTPTAINERGDIVGFMGDPAFPEGDILHGFIWTKQAGLQPLGALPGHVHSEAYGINERRQVVGVSCDADFADCRAFIWEDGVMQDLNALKAPGYTGHLEHGRDINDRGEITGRAADPVTGARSAFLAVP